MFIVIFWRFFLFNNKLVFGLINGLSRGLRFKLGNIVLFGLGVEFCLLIFFGLLFCFGLFVMVVGIGGMGGVGRSFGDFCFIGCLDICFFILGLVGFVILFKLFCFEKRGFIEFKLLDWLFCLFILGFNVGFIGWIFIGGFKGVRCNFGLLVRVFELEFVRSRRGFYWFIELFLVFKRGFFWEVFVLIGWLVRGLICFWIFVLLFVVWFFVVFMCFNSFWIFGLFLYFGLERLIFVGGVLGERFIVIGMIFYIILFLFEVINIGGGVLNGVFWDFMGMIGGVDLFFDLLNDFGFCFFFGFLGIEVVEL